MTVTKNIYNSVEKSKENISMKIDIITLHYIRNYGSVLQTYATQAKFEAMGYEAEIVDYVRPNAEDGAMIEEGFEKKNLHGIKKMLYIGLKKFEFSKRNRVCIDFLNKYCKLTRRYKLMCTARAVTKLGTLSIMVEFYRHTF